MTIYKKNKENDIQSKRFNQDMVNEEKIQAKIECKK